MPRRRTSLTGSSKWESLRTLPAQENACRRAPRRLAKPLHERNTVPGHSRGCSSQSAIADYLVRGIGQNVKDRREIDIDSGRAELARHQLRQPLHLIRGVFVRLVRGQAPNA
jgi:hypothetical protein